MSLTSRVSPMVACGMVLGMLGSAGCGRRYEVPTADVRGVVTVNGPGVEGIQVKFVPKEFNENASGNPAYQVDIPVEGLEFNYDIKYDGEIPPYNPG